MRTKLLDAMRRALRDCEQSRYALSKQTGIAQSQLSRFLAGGAGLNHENIEKLADAMGFEIVLRRKGGKRGQYIG